MARRPTEPRYFTSRGGYYVQINRQQHLLAAGPEDDPKVKDEAWTNFHALMAANDVLTEGDRNPLFALLNKYLLWAKANKSPNTYKIRLKFLQSFSDKWGTLPVKDLKKHHVEEWLAEHMEYRRDERRKTWVRWGMSTRRSAITSLITALNWSVDQGIISKNPVARMKRPAQVSRSVESLITDAQHRLFLERASRRHKKGFRDLLIALFETGARPGEVAGMEAKNYNPKMGTWVIDSGPGVHGHNKLAYQGRRRVIFLTKALQELVERLNREHPQGPIFRAQNGRAYTEQSIVKRLHEYRHKINEEFREAGKPEPFTPHITAYSYRHRFVTDWLMAGKPVGYLADLLGTSINMITKHYSHLSEKSEALRRELLQFQRGAAAPDPSAPPANDVAS
jgi:integrase